MRTAPPPAGWGILRTAPVRAARSHRELANVAGRQSPSRCQPAPPPTHAADDRRLDRDHRLRLPGRDSGPSPRSPRSASTRPSPRTRRAPEPGHADRPTCCPRRRSSRPDRQDRAGPLRRRPARGRRRSSEIPPILLDATTAIEDKTFWENAGFDPVAIVVGRPRLAARRQPRRLDDHPAARPRSACSTRTSSRTRSGPAERKLKEIIQSIRVTQAFPGEDGKQEIITAYLNQNYYGNQSYGVKAAAEAYFGIELDEIDPGPGRDPRRRCRSRRRTTTSSATPSSGARRTVAEGGDLPGQDDRARRARRHQRSSQRRNAILDLLAEPAGRRCPATSTPPADFRAAKDEDGRPRASQTTPRWIAPHFVWAVRDELAEQAVRRRTTRPATRSSAAACASRRRSTSPLQKIAEKWVRAAAIVPHATRPGGGRQGARLRRAARRWMANLRDKDAPQRRARRARLPDRRARRLRRQRRATTRPRPRPAFQPQFDVVGKGYRQPGSAFKPFNYVDRHRRRDDDRRRRCSWTSAPTSAATTRRATPTTSSAARSASATRSSSRSTSRRSRRWRSTAPTTSSPRPRTSGCASRPTRPTPGWRSRSASRRSGRSTS